ncbi:hypothetical protein QBC42DRAFT_278632 [Cladorrhinum samala]|uniref:Uncharacterized protein n=1 Tax=Cladorrhinum samala TaxID=585594 RepID=A0AAV9HCJ2_9PEZI|nr:hypothetical protein QBC42DRAFT_278632 [Cladorrhinum samala]
MNTTEPCYVLAAWARPIAQGITAMACARKETLTKLPPEHRRWAGEILTRLEMIYSYMQLIPPYLVEDSMNQLSMELLGELAKMLNSSHQIRINYNIKECVAIFHKHFDTSNYIIRPDRILSFFKKASSQALIQSINQNCAKIFSMLNQDDDAEHTQGLPADTRFLDRNNHSIDLSSGMLQVLQSHLHGLETPASACQGFKYPARLCLSDE